MKIKLSEIKKVNLRVLKINSKNNLFFKFESGKYFDELQKDIKQRGITVPLIAKKDGTLLCGHNRLLIAKTLKLKTVPVQYIESKLTEDQEIEYIIKDNLLRRHLTPAERDQLYRKLIPDFDEKIMIKHSRRVSVNAKELSEKTGLNPKTIAYDFARIRKEKQKTINNQSPIDFINEKAIAQYKKAVSKMLNVAIIEKASTKNKLIEITEMALKRLKNM